MRAEPKRAHILLATFGSIVGAAMAAGCGAAASQAGASPSPGPSSRAVIPQSSAATSPAPACESTVLRVTAEGGGPAAGNVGLRIAFTNVGSTTCSLSGWPEVKAITAAGTQASPIRSLTTMFGPARLKGPPVVTLPPGGRALAVLAGQDVPAGDTSCPAPYQKLAVTPPGGSTATVISAWVPDLDAYMPACTRLVISPVVPPDDVAGGGG